MTTTVKHGIYLQQHKNGNVTKTIYNNGHVMRVYRRCPKSIQFKSPMVNDLNQHLCGGWYMKDIGKWKEHQEAILKQLINGNKPFGITRFRKHEYAELADAQRRLDAAGLVVETRPRREESFDLIACHSISVNEIGDLSLLQADYEDAGLEMLWFDQHDGRSLYSYFDGWDVGDVPEWLTGLILGYPVENTISIMKS